MMLHEPTSSVEKIKRLLLTLLGLNVLLTLLVNYEYQI